MERKKNVTSKKNVFGLFGNIQNLGNITVRFKILINQLIYAMKHRHLFKKDRKRKEQNVPNTNVLQFVDGILKSVNRIILSTIFFFISLRMNTGCDFKILPFDHYDHITTSHTI